MIETNTSVPSSNSWLDKPFFEQIKINGEVILFTVIIIFAIISRFYDLGTRVMSHDESLHTYYSWKLYRGEGYQHTPMMHGPLQFHLIALSYFLFGDSDFTSRIPHALASILSVVFLWNFRRYLGRAGALIAAALWVISPYMLYYGRYARNEAFVGLFGLMTLWAILRYLETGKNHYLFWLTAATVLHFTSKETAFIYTAQALLFLGFYFLHRLSRQSWEYKKAFFTTLVLGLAIFISGLGLKIVESHSGTTTPTPPAPTPAETAAVQPSSPLVWVLLGIGLVFIILAFYFLVRGFTRERLLKERSFNAIVLLFTLVMPQLAAFPVSMMGWAPTDYSPDGLAHTAIFLIPLTLLALGIGFWWNWQIWLPNALLFYGVYVVFYTTLFTNGGGFFSGLVGSLGYWIEQQGVQRGSQPWYYYILIQLPIYEYLPVLGSFFAALLYFFIPGLRGTPVNEEDEPAEDTIQPPQSYSAFSTPNITLPLLLFWALTSVMAFSIAGEKMPWLTVHLTLGMILLSGWSFGVLVEKLNWREWNTKQGWLSTALLIVFLLSLPVALGSLLGPERPFMGKELPQLQATSLFLTSFVTCLLSAYGLYRLLRDWSFGEYARFILLGIFSFLALLTMRTAYTATYINYDQANEYLVYAHSARGVKDVLKQVEEISLRTTDGLAMVVAYDDDTSWPMTWYMRNFTNQRYYGNAPGKDLREVPAIIVGDNNYSKIEPVVGKAFYQFDYIRMVWPNQDYFDLNWDRIRFAISDPQMRAAIFDIWLNRDFKAYGFAVKQDFSINNWNPADRMRLYLRKDVVSKIWEYGTMATVSEESLEDPYQNNHIKLTAAKVIGSNGTQPGQFQAPRNVAIAPDGSLFVADSGNHRIQHLNPDGSVIKVWGQLSPEGNPAPGTFNEPWGIAIGPDNTVYVADTWNHRIQKFTANGEYITSWGHFGQAETHDAFWGPRQVAIDAKGRIFITDTGNKRVVVFTSDGKFITEFGGYGLELGRMDEPVGIAIAPDQTIYIADTWNQRIQAFKEQTENFFAPLREWEIVGWYGQSLDNKPYITINPQGHVFSSDPEGYRILEFDPEGKYIRSWGDFSDSLEGFGIVNGLAADDKGGIWVCDTTNHRLLYFILP